MNNAPPLIKPKSYWPTNGIEQINKCPVCSSKESKIIHKNIEDILFGSPLGAWEFHLCLSCESGYLKTRPTESTIELAYRNYYTHGTQKLTSADLKKNTAPKGNIKSIFNKIFLRTRLKKINFIRFILNLIPVVRWSIKNSYRHLPRANKNCELLLDVGCGDGSFMSLAESRGWRTFGIDTDSLAVEKCLMNGLQASVGDITMVSLKDNYYDVVTCSHVIEHVHDPLLFLSIVTSKIKKGGILWIQTPNIKSLGHQYFNEYWRGLEVPRHLVIFNVNSLERLLQNLGYEIKQMPWNMRELKDIYFQSAMLKKKGGRLSIFERFILVGEVFKDGLIEWIQPQKREFITFKAIKQ